jgi:hypothetical protein
MFTKKEAVSSAKFSLDAASQTVMLEIFYNIN